MCIARYEAGTHTQQHFVRAVSHSVSAPTAALITVHVLNDNGSDSGGGFTNMPSTIAAGLYWLPPPPSPMA